MFNMKRAIDQQSRGWEFKYSDTQHGKSNGTAIQKLVDVPGLTIHFLNANGFLFDILY